MAHGGPWAGPGRNGPGHYELRLPPGWENCDEFGRPIAITADNKVVFRVIPSKVPLSPAFDRLLTNINRQYTLRTAVDKVETAFHCKVGLVLDLTNSTRYYDFYREFNPEEQRYIRYAKVPCRGRGQVPSPAAVNHVVFELTSLLENDPNAYVLMHCTHGFNRTGYVMVCAMVRMFANRSMTVSRAIRKFAEARPPGIYKDAYVNALFKYHHERRSQRTVTPPVPVWKGHTDDDDDDDLGPSEPEAARPVEHENIHDIGEPLLPDEVQWLQGMVYHLLTGTIPNGNQRRLHFPGSQPVSLDRDNLDLLTRMRYFVSWKADGTRYLLLILDRGCYLINRGFEIVRLQMRFPTNATKPSVRPGHKPPDPTYPVGKPHHLTLLDGEMVVDDDNGTRKRRYLAYDIAFLNEEPLLNKPWEVRFKLLRDEVIVPRNKEIAYIAGQTDPRERYLAPPLEYHYYAEPFSVRRKDFWQLHQANKVMHMISSLCHGSDGLILQSTDTQYVVNTDNALLKFKFAEHNSVDFKLSVSYPDDSKTQPNFTLWLVDTSGPKGGPRRNARLVSITTPVAFPEGVDGVALDQCIIECNWLRDQQSWGYMRRRTDKDSPNASHVYEKVMKSILEDIKVPELLQYLESVFWHCQAYGKDRSEVPPDRVPKPLPPPPDSLSIANTTTSTSLPKPPHGQTLPPPPPHFSADQQQQQQTSSTVNALNHHHQEDHAEEPPMMMDDDQDVHYQEAPVSPPYFGPECTPPHDPPKSSSQPYNPMTLWRLHDPATYPFHILHPPPPSHTTTSPNNALQQRHATTTWHDNGSGSPQPAGDAHLTQHTSPNHDGGATPSPDNGDILPYYVDDDEYNRRHPNAPLAHVPGAANGVRRQGMTDTAEMDVVDDGVGGGSAAAAAATSAPVGHKRETAQPSEASSPASVPPPKKKAVKARAAAPVQYDTFDDL